MQDIGSDIEELFRRAAGDYPLKPGEDRWNDIASKINVQPLHNRANKHQGGYKKYYAVLMFLLFFLSIDSFFLRQVPDQNNNLQKMNPDFVKEVTGDTQTPKALAKNISDNTNNLHQSAPGKENRKWLLTNFVNNNFQQQELANQIPGISDKQIKNDQSLNRLINVRNDFEIKMLDRSAPFIIKNINSTESKSKVSFSNVSSPITVGSAGQFVSSLSNAADKKIKIKGPKPSLYYSLVVGTGVNSIKDQDIKKVGLDIGLTGGVRFNKHLSAETGVLFSQKYYTTSGEYFSLNKIGSAMPAAMKVLEVKGSSMVVEIPVHLRYDVINKRGHRAFTTAGFSSYLLTKESNKYLTSLNGTEGVMYGTYKTNQGYFAASVDLAIGYEKIIGKRSSIKLQPYLQLPVKGIGVGNLKVKSAGIHIALTRSTQ